MANVLITGGSGFIGQRLAAQLKQRGDHVVCLVRKTSKVEPLRRLGVQLVEGDVTVGQTLPAALRNTPSGTNVDLVMHLAGAVFVRRSKDFYRVNTEGAHTLARACAECSPPPVLVYVSSLAAVGPSPANQPHRETDPPAPISHYGKSKWAAEQRLWEWADELPITILRPPIVFGPGDPHLLKMFRSIKKGWHVVPGLAPNRYSLVHVDDLIDGLLRGADHGRRLVHSADGLPDFDGVYFIAQREQPTYAELGDLIGMALKCDTVRKVRIPKPLCYAFAGVVQGVGLFMERPRVLNLDKIREATGGSWICRIDRAEQQLGFSPPRTLAERLEETARWYQEQGAL